MGYRVLPARDTRYTELPGLEGPFFYPNGRVLYYDPVHGAYWDPTTDFYLTNEEFDLVNNSFYEALKGK